MYRQKGILLMAKTFVKKVAFISSYIPRRCGIATFTNDLIRNISSIDRDFEPLVVAMRSGDDKYKEPVKFEIRQDVKSDYISAADYINFSHVDLVSVQHEFGLFGGSAGSYLSLLLNRLNAPVITTLHTVLDSPQPDYHKSLVDVCAASGKIVVMNERGVEMLHDIYGVSESKLVLIPHGIPDIPFVDTNYYKHKFGIEGKKTILTFGLLSKNKGIEMMLKALPDIIQAEPSVLYIVLGMTHPEVLKYDGESYRFSLQRLVEELKCTQNVMFHNRFVSDQELHNFLCAADIYVTPYLNLEQLTSGTLSFAVGAGKAVVSTPFWAAQELLADGRGKLVKFADPKQLSSAIIELLKDQSLFYSLRRKAYDYGRSRIWPKIGQIYWDLFSKIKTPLVFSEKTALAISKGKFELPELSLTHLKRLSDDVGILQHSKFIIPERKHGYCTDDNARAVITMARYYTQYHDPESLKLLSLYLSFILNSQDEEGFIRNLMNYDRTWQEDEPFNDALGRFLWALGTVMANPPTPAYLPIIKDCFHESARHVLRQMPKGMSYSIIGMGDYLRQFPGASEIKRQMELAADELIRQFEENAQPDWQWFEEILTYDNAILPYALFVACQHLSDKYFEVAEKSCRFLLSKTFNGSNFSFVGSDGWYERGASKAQFDQQPIEALSTILMLKAAYDVKGDIELLRLMKKAFNWFLGENDLQIPVYNFTTQGCNDGLMQTGVNENQGAESILSFLLSLLTIIENYTLFEKIEESPESKKNQSPQNSDIQPQLLPIQQLPPSASRQSKNEVTELK
jgi:glycosyltransferase involved in cell wall biosynthesis